MNRNYIRYQNFKKTETTHHSSTRAARNNSIEPVNFLAHMLFFFFFFLISKILTLNESEAEEMFHNIDINEKKKITSMLH